VDRWQERLAPLLEEEEKRPVFDIHEYGETVIKSLMEGISRTKNNDPSNKTISFAEVTAHASRYEVCRLFLASLSLGGSGNVNIFQPNNDKSAPLQLELLCRDIERPMETYLAPSVAETS
jgi:condensin-2 complex subunit H2